MPRLYAGLPVTQGRGPLKVPERFAVALLQEAALLIRQAHLIQRIRAVRFSGFPVSLQGFFLVLFRVIPGGVGIGPGITRFGGFLVIRQGLCVILGNRYAVLVIVGDHPAGIGVAVLGGGQIAFRRPVQVHLFSAQSLGEIFAPNEQRAAVPSFRRIADSGQRFGIPPLVIQFPARLVRGHEPGLAAVGAELGLIHMAASVALPSAAGKPALTAVIAFIFRPAVQALPAALRQRRYRAGESQRAQKTNQRHSVSFHFPLSFFPREARLTASQYAPGNRSSARRVRRR